MCNLSLDSALVGPRDYYVTPIVGSAAGLALSRDLSSRHEVPPRQRAVLQSAGFCTRPPRAPAPGPAPAVCTNTGHVGQPTSTSISHLKNGDHTRCANGHVLVLAAHSPQHFDLHWGSCPLGYSCDRIINGGDLSSPSQGGHGPQVWLVELSFPGLRLWTRVAPKGSQWVEAREPARPLSPRLGPAGMPASESAFLPLLSRHLCTSAFAYFALDLLGPVRLTPWTPANLNCFLPAQLPPQKGRHHLARTCSRPSAPSVLFRPSLASALSQSALLLCCLSSRSHPWKGPDARGEAERAKMSEPFSWLTHSSST